MSDGGLLAATTVVRERELHNIRNSLRLLAPYLDDDMVTDIFVNTDGQVSICHFGTGIQDVNVRLSEANRLQVMNQIAQWLNMLINRDHYPVIEGTIPIPEWYSRLTGIYPPWVDSPTFAIRKTPKRVFTLDEYVESGRLSKSRYNLICKYVKEKKNIIIAGATGSGKTTFANAVIHLMAELTPTDRFYIVQDNAELLCEAKYTTPVIIKKEQAMRAVQLALRFFPRRIIFGEVRDGHVMDQLLDAWNTGHPGGITTIHSDTAQSALVRIRSLLRQIYLGELPDYLNIIHLVVHLSPHPKLGVTVDEVLETRNYDDAYLATLSAMQKGIGEENQEVVP